MDDEYKWAGVEDPKIMITTSRDPSSRLKQFAKVGLHLVMSHNIHSHILASLLKQRCQRASDSECLCPPQI